MGRRKKKEGEHENSERWLLTYSDMITLLTAFFIMMYSMSVLNLAKFQQVAVSIRSGFGGQMANAGHSVLNPAMGVSQKPAVIQEVAALQPAQIVKEMRQFIKENKLEGKIRLHSTERGVIVSMVTDKALFPKGQAGLTPETAQVLNHIIGLIAKTDSHIRVEGHTDNLPISNIRYPSNWELSALRATTVVRYLINKGINPQRLSATGYADSRPLLPNDSEAHRAYNRRVDLVILQGSVEPPEH